MKRTGLMVTTLLVLTLIAPGARAALQIDFEEAGDDDNTLPAGFISLSGSPSNGTNSYTFNNLSAGFGSGGTVDVTLAGTDTRFLDRNAVTSGDGLGAMGRDFVFTPAATNGLNITISGLLANDYTFTGYFHDATVDQGVVDVFVDITGAGSSFVQVLDDVAYTTGVSVAALGQGSFNFTADGVNDVIVRIFNPGPTQADLINGFTLSIPTPAALPAGLAMMLGLVTRRRR